MAFRIKLVCTGIVLLCIISILKAQDFVFSPNFGGVGSQVKISKNSRLLAILQYDGIEVWDTKSNKQIAYVKVPINSELWGFNNDCSRLYFTAYPDIFNVYDLTDRAISKTFKCPEKKEVCIADDGQSFIASDGINYKLYDVSTGSVCKSYSIPFFKTSNVGRIGTDKKHIVFLDAGKIRVKNILTLRDVSLTSLADGVDFNEIAISNDLNTVAVAGSNNNLQIYNTKQSKLTFSIKLESKVKELLFDNQSNNLFIIGSDIRVFDITTGVFKANYLHNFYGVTPKPLSISDQKFVIASDKKTLLYSLETETFEKEIGQTKPIDKYSEFDFNPISNSCLMLTDSMVVSWDFDSFSREVILVKKPGWKEAFRTVKHTPNGKSFVVTTAGGMVYHFDLKSHILISSFERVDGDCLILYITKDSKYIALSVSANQPIEYYNLNTGKLAFKVDVLPICYTQPEDQQKIVFGDLNSNILAFGYGTGQKLYEYNHSNILVGIAISPNLKFLAAIDASNQILVLDYQTGKKIKELVQKEGEVIEYSKAVLYFSDDSKQFVVANPGGKKVGWDTNSWSQLGQLDDKRFANYYSKKTKLSLKKGDFFISAYDNKETNLVCQILSAENEWLIFTPDGFFESSAQGGELVSMAKGLDGFGIDQFAFYKNRPDVIMTRLGSKNLNMIDYYKKQYLKRLKKFSLPETTQQIDTDLPSVEIVKSTVQQDLLTLEIAFSDNKSGLKDYNIFVNNVPLYSKGKVISGSSVVLSEKIILCSGSNKIEVTCYNEKGSESYRALTTAYVSEQKKRDLYLLAFGVSKYKNPSYNLAYADKDALDLEKVALALKGKGFENVYTKVLTNEQVTPNTIKEAKDFVNNAKPDDTYILFIAGHGMHDKDSESTYYYLTSNADLNNLKGTAVDFETIEDLLKGIPPRNKLFLMDACESGEIDDEDQGQMLATATGVGIASRGFKTTSTPSTVNFQRSTKRSYLYQKDRFIFNDLSRRSGAIVFSSSKGGELSYERSDIENGLFTEFIVKALSSTLADRDSNGIVSTDELREYVSTQVAKASGDLQHPTVDRDNIFQKFGFGIK